MYYLYFKKTLNTVPFGESKMAWLWGGGGVSTEHGVRGPVLRFLQYLNKSGGKNGGTVFRETRYCLNVIIETTVRNYSMIIVHG